MVLAALPSRDSCIHDGKGSLRRMHAKKSTHACTHPDSFSLSGTPHVPHTFWGGALVLCGSGGVVLVSFQLLSGRVAGASGASVFVAGHACTHALQARNAHARTPLCQAPGRRTAVTSAGRAAACCCWRGEGGKRLPGQGATSLLRRWRLRTACGEGPACCPVSGCLWLSGESTVHT